jgi:protein phosphatase
MTARMAVASKTDPGKRRAENQDAVLAQAMGNGHGEPQAYLLAVADGVGGGPGGRLASGQAVQCLAAAILENATANPSEALRRGFHSANSSVRSMAESNSELAGMASTLTAAFVREGRVWLANVGDSRTYLVRGRNAAAMTYDHSWVAEQVEAGRMTASEAASDPRRNLITRAIGVDAALEPDLYKPVSLEDGDILVLCSDGLYSVVNDAEIARLAAASDLHEAVESMVALANERGGPDNISIVLAVWRGQ